MGWKRKSYYHPEVILILSPYQTMALDDEMEIQDAAFASQGKVQGIIIPPPDIRAVVDKTAQFVAR